MKKIISCTLVLSMLLPMLFSCHEHTAPENVPCTEDACCTECGEVLTPAKGHTPGEEATCTAPQTCTVCGAELAPAKGHTPGAEATCTTPQTCTVCGEVIAEPSHKPDAEATCTKGSTCTVCGAEISPALGHEPGAAPTATEPQTCTRCGVVLKQATGSFSAKYLEETVSEGHYINSLKAYYKGSILICGNYAMEYFGANQNGDANYAKLVSNFAKKYPNVKVNCMIVPKCCSFHSPDGYTDQFENHKNGIKATYSLMDPSVNTIDAFGEMAQHRGEYLFYRTDHHWTSLGAYYASVAFCKGNGITPRALSSYQTVINDNYYGTLYAWSGNPACLQPDYTVAHLPAVGYKMTYTVGNQTYNGTAINTKTASYASAFICGDQPLVDIVTENKNGRKLLIFKESYGNAFAPYMIDYFEEVVIVDIRKDTKSVAKIIEEYGITDALIINNMQGAASLQSYLGPKLAS